jgi:hypothetical protein
MNRKIQNKPNAGIGGYRLELFHEKLREQKSDGLVISKE